ncbi:MFS transporter [Desulfitobacterium sp. THU1]|uniref:MFS transporter n=1 Tax=Desulfitobacterium sp. THU1 TaxID=3138072 RepID=UPI00311E0E5E
MSEKKLHYAWFILAGCCALTAGMGILLNTGGQWFVSVTKELNISVSTLSLYFTVQGLCMAFTAPFVGKLLPKVNLRLLLTGCYSAVILAIAAMSQYQSVWGWYISGAVLGIAGAFCFLIPAPVILSQWFAKKTGLAVGIAMAFSGISAAIMNPIIAGFIQANGWRAAYLLAAGVTAILVLPFTLFVLRFKPADMGLKPFGYEENAAASAAQAASAATGVPANVAMRSLSFILLFCVFGLIAFSAGFSQLLPTYAKSIGFAATIGATMASMAMIGNIVGKLSLGVINDKFGALKTSLFGLSIVAVSFILLLLAKGNTTVILAASFFYGFSLSMTAVVSPLLVRGAYGAKDYPVLFANLSIGQSLIGAFGMPIIGFIAELTGSFATTFIVTLSILALTAVLILLAFNNAKKLTQA